MGLLAVAVEESERIEDRGIKGIFGESVACLARYRLHAAGVVDPFVILIKF